MRSLRPLALGFASALTLALALAGVARAGDVTYPSLTTATTVQDTDLIATWRASGPLTKVQASVLEAYLQGKLSSLFLQSANNLSDVASAATARTNLGLGSAAQASTGTSGTTLCMMNANCTWSGTEMFNGAVTFNSTAVHTGLLTANGGIADNGALSVSGAAMFSSVSASGGISGNGVSTTGASGSYRYLSLQTNGSERWDLDASNTSEGSGCTGSSNGCSGADFQIGRWDNTGAFIDIPIQIYRQSGNTYINDGLWVGDGLTVTSGSVSLPAGSVVNADLDSVNGSPGSCGSSTTTCTFTTNAQGRITAQGSAPMHAAMSGATAGALETNNGSSVSWAQRASAYFSSCSSGGCSLAAGNGISGVTRNATGNYTVNFSVNFPNANFTVICTSGPYGGGNWNATCTDNSPNNGRSVSSVGIEIVTGGNSPIDPSGGFNIVVLQN